MRFFTALLVVALLYTLHALQAFPAHAQTCAPLVPPPVSGSLTPAPATPGSVVINEVLSYPKSIWYCPVPYPVADAPWVELYNPHDQPFDLYSVHTSIDMGPNSRPYYLPLGAAIAPHGFLVLFPTLYTNTLAAGTTVRLVIAGVAVDQIVLPTLGLDQSYARVPDGATTWQNTSAPTIDASNTSSSATPTPTPTPTASPSQARTKGYSHTGNSYPTDGQSPTRVVNGLQPMWSTLQLPTPDSAVHPPDAPSQTLSSPAISSPTDSGMDVPHLLLMGLLAIALGLVLFWCWRLFAHA